VIVNIVIGALILGYAGWMVVRHVKRSAKGKCAACAVREGCSGTSCGPGGTGVAE
jgi:hypothetical protein